MTLLADGDSNLIERHDILILNGVHYLVEPLHKASVYARLPFLKIASNYSRRDLLWTILAQLSLRLSTLRKPSRSSRQTGSNNALSITKR